MIVSLRRIARIPAVPYLLLALLVLMHRLILFVVLHSRFDALIALNPDLLIWQFLPLPILRDQLLTGLFYLQQNPPLPQLILGIVLKATSFPFGSAHALLAVQALISTATALLLYRVLLLVPIRRVAAWLLAAVFALSADLILLEYNGFGQTFYESLCMPLLLGVAWSFQRVARERRRCDLLVLGLLVAMLALSRASFGYFLLPIVAALLLAGVGVRGVLLCLVPVLVLQGGWALKNRQLYGYFSLPATSWTGSNLAIGVVKRDLGQYAVLRGSILAHPEDHPLWFERMVAEKGIAYWEQGAYQPYVSTSVRERDRQISEALPGNPASNSLGQALVSKQNQKAVRRYVQEDPLRFAGGVLLSYRQFWHPIREYARMFLGPILPVQSLEEMWREGGVGEVLRRYELDNYRILQYAWRPLNPIDPCTVGACHPGGPLALPYLPLLVYLFAIVAVNGLGPVLLLVSLRRDIGIDRRFVLFLYLIFAYVAGVTSIGDHGENHRFRLAVEPVIWVLTAAIAAGWLRSLRGVWTVRAETL